jgi:erythromycin esterase-like protein
MIVTSNFRKFGDNKISSNTIMEKIKKCNIPLNSSKDLDPLMNAIGDAKYVLLGEATHGTSEFYRWRKAISQRLIQEKGFRFIAVEGDWPDCFEVNKYVKNQKGQKSAKEVLIENFKRWPTWMWANWEISDLMEWMKNYNEKLPIEQQVGFYGLDVYSLYESMQTIMKFVNELGDPEAIASANDVFRCFQPYAKDPVQYGLSAIRKRFSGGCYQEVLKLLTYMKKKYDSNVEQSGGMRQEEIFDALMNTKVITDAEKYYKVMLLSDAESWNVRDDHMADTLDSLMKFHGDNAKCIVWAHNTHVGDARFTDMVEAGERNIGQIVRERHENEGVFLVGFGMNEGTVIAGSSWDAPMEKMEAPSAPARSWEYLINHTEAKIPNKLLIFTEMDEEDRKAFDDVRGNRAIGVVYHKESDRLQWVPTVLGRRYDAFIQLNRTMALHPLPARVDHSLQPPQTYPFGSHM